MGISLRRLRLVVAIGTALLLALSVLLILPGEAGATSTSEGKDHSTTTTEHNGECEDYDHYGSKGDKGGGKDDCDHDDCKDGGDKDDCDHDDCKDGGDKDDCDHDDCKDGGDDDCGVTTTTIDDSSTTTVEEPPTTESTTTTIAPNEVTTTQPALDIPSIRAECVNEIPFLSYVVDFPGATSATITFLNPTGPDVVHANVPLSGQVLWPGASEDPLDWPGWVNENGTWVFKDDGYMWARGTVNVLFEVNPSKVVPVPYPPASEICADPENKVDDDVLGTVVTTAPETVEGVEELPFTGSNDLGLVALALGVIGLGTVMVLSTRREEEQ